MIDCEGIGKIAITGKAADILSEFAFITGCLVNTSIEKADIVEAFTVGLYHEEIMDKGPDWEKSWDKISEMVNAAFRKEAAK